MNIRALVQSRVRDIFSAHASTVQRKGPTSNTTLVGFICEHGKKVLMSADRMTSEDMNVYSMISHKLYPIGTNAILAGTGLVADVQQIVEIEGSIASTISRETGEELSAEGKIGILQNILRSASWLPEAWFVYGGYDPDLEGFVCNIDCCGGFYRFGYASDGCGKPHAEDILDQFWSKDLSSAEALELSVKALLQAGKRSTHSANPILSPVDIVFISEKGIEWVDEKKVNKVIKSMSPAYFKRQREQEDSR